MSKAQMIHKESQVQVSTCRNLFPPTPAPVPCPPVEDEQEQDEDAQVHKLPPALHGVAEHDLAAPVALPSLPLLPTLLCGPGAGLGVPV